MTVAYVSEVGLTFNLFRAACPVERLRCVYKYSTGSLGWISIMPYQFDLAKTKTMSNFGYDQQWLEVSFLPCRDLLLTD